MAIPMTQRAGARCVTPKSSWLGSIEILLMICVLLLGGISEGESLSHTNQHELVTIAQVCQKSARSGSKTPFLTSLQVSRLIDVKQDYQIAMACDTKYWTAIRELRTLLAPKQLQDVCSDKMYETIRAYHVRFIHYYVPEGTRSQLLEQRRLFKKNAEPIPAPLRDFFILFVKEINSACKRSLMMYLKDESRPLEKELSIFESFGHEFSKLSHQLRWLSKKGLNSFDANYKAAGKFNRLQIVDLEGIRHNESGLRADIKLFVPPNSYRILKTVKLVCKHRFRPLYMDLFAPVIRLNNLGYIERTWNRIEDKKLDKEASLLRWHDIIRVCEAFKNIQVHYDPARMATFEIGANSALKLDKNIYSKVTRLANKIEILDQVESPHKGTERDFGIQPLYNPQPLRLSHRRISYVCHTCQCKELDTKRELNLFRRDLSRFVWRRTSRLTGWRERIFQSIRFANFVITGLIKRESTLRRDIKDWNLRLGMLISASMIFIVVVLGLATFFTLQAVC